MADTKSSIQNGIQNAADKAKEATAAAVDKGKEAATATGDAIKNAGEQVKKAGS